MANVPAQKPLLMIVIDVESTEVQTRNKKAGGTYDLQYGYFHETERDGTPKRVRRELSIFPPKIDGKTVPYPVGQYTLHPRSLEIDEGGFPKLGFLTLTPITAKV